MYAAPENAHARVEIDCLGRVDPETGRTAHGGRGGKADTLSTSRTSRVQNGVLRAPPGAPSVARVRRHGWILLLTLAVLAAAAALLVRPHAHRARLHANPALTPGALNPDVTQRTIGATICVSGWTRTVRPPSSYTHSLKIRQMREYGEAGRTRDYQEDHFISLELGGAPTDPRNLWPEPQPRAREVDRIENELNHAVCSGRLTLREAQRREAEVKYRGG